MQRWEFKDLTTNETRRLTRNPRTMSTLQVQRSTQAELDLHGKARVLRKPVGGFPWEFVGVIHEQADYDAMLAWASRELLQVTDHLGRRHKVIPLAFLPTAIERNGTRNPWLYEYTFKTIYLGRLP